MRFAGFVMTYRRPEILGGTLSKIFEQTRPPERLLVVDNGACDRTRALVEGADDPRLVYRRMPDNLGPAGAAAFGLETLTEQGFEWMYWAGDDGPPAPSELLERLLELAGEAPGQLGAVAGGGVDWDWSRGRMVRIPSSRLRGAVAVDAVPGGSVLLVHRRTVERAGLPDVRLFWGFEDIEYCLRMRRAGLRLLASGEVMRERRERADRLDLAYRRSPVPREPIDRLARSYYTTRNLIFVMRRTFGRPDLARRRALKGLVRCVAAWARGPRFGRAFATMELTAIRDGYRGRMGRTRELSPEPVIRRGAVSCF